MWTQFVLPICCTSARGCEIFRGQVSYVKNLVIDHTREKITYWATLRKLIGPMNQYFDA